MADRKLKFVAVDYAAFSPDHRGSYRITHIIGEWVAEYIERGLAVEPVLTSKSLGACVDACERHAKERSDD